MSRSKKSSAKPTKSNRQRYDVVIVGGGPVGLACAASLKDLGLKIALVEKQDKRILANPEIDGRDTALTHSSRKIFKDLKMFDRLPTNAVSPIREAKVLNGVSPYALRFDSADEGKEALGYLVSNHLIRKAAFEAVDGQDGLDFFTGTEVTDLVAGTACNTVTLSNGKVIEATLVVAADSRFSNCRRLMGVPVEMRDFGRTVVVCRVQHQKRHRNIAYECFHYGRTLAVLPLAGNVASVVITLPSEEVGKLLALSAEEFSRDLTSRFGDYLGSMKLVGKRHSYPLVATYAQRFIGPRFVLLGDAAVGMHPVTAHGYNFGLYGVRTLATEIRAALELGLDIGSAILLEKFNKEHRRATRGLYLGTNALVSIFTNEKPAAKLVRAAMLRLGNFTKPAKTLITRQLTQDRLAG